MTRPNSCVHLRQAIERYCEGTRDPLRLGRAMANVILGQMLPEGVVKGGSSLLFRYGGACTRYTRDIDTARVSDLDAYVARLRENLARGWNGFTGRAVEAEPATPDGIPPAYLMIPYDIKLNYNNKPWQTIRIEIGHNEIGDADLVEHELQQDLADAFVALGFPRPDKIAVMSLPHQIAQKLHAVSEDGSVRAHDLVDLQLICAMSAVDWSEVREVCQRLFAYRKRQSWPPRIALGTDWDSLYAIAVDKLVERGTVLDTAADAVDWANDLIEKIANA